MSSQPANLHQLSLIISLSKQIILDSKQAAFKLPNHENVVFTLPQDTCKQGPKLFHKE